MSDEDRGAQLRDAGIAAADGAAPEDWKAAAEDVLRGLCAEPGRTFTCDDVWAALAARGVEPPPEPRALAGPIMRFKRSGMIAMHGYATTTRAVRHKAPVTVWRVVPGFDPAKSVAVR